MLIFFVLLLLLNLKTFSFQGEFSVKLEIESVTQTDKGSYKLVAKNEKGEATSQTVEVTEIPEEEEVKKGNKPEFSQGLTSVVSALNVAI
jgi:ABC-type Na+ efflux pump permease subunit